MFYELRDIASRFHLSEVLRVMVPGDGFTIISDGGSLAFYEAGRERVVSDCTYVVISRCSKLGWGNHVTVTMVGPQGPFSLSA